jgi:hypothetical protein
MGPLSRSAVFGTECLASEGLVHHLALEEAPAPHRSRSGTRAEQGPRWLMSGPADFWLVCAGSGAALILVALVLLWHGDWELGIADLVFAELHLGATCGAIAQRRLWRRMPIEVVAVPAVILAATYALTLRGWSVFLVTSIVYLGAWHRTRQNLGIARHYQRLAGGPRSRSHQRILAAAMYLPMAATVAYFTGASPLLEGEPYLALPLPSFAPSTLGALAVASLILYLASETARVGRYGNWGCRSVHPAERWLVIANAIGFASAYVLGAWTASFVLVLVLHHEIQYLAFTYATARAGAQPLLGVRAKLTLLASFAMWPMLNLAMWTLCRGWDPPASVEPFLTAGLLAHYWWDGRIWTGRARRLAV